MRLKYFFIIFLIVSFVSCDNFLDVMPDSRTQIDTPQKVKDLLVTSYPTANYALLCEFSSDNIIDNRSESATLKADAYDRMDTEIFEWRDVSSSTSSDSPYAIWQQFYQSIAAANLVLESIDNLIEGGETTDMSAQKGEALLLRAYCHFILVNIFAQPYKDANLSQDDLGITYMTKSEKKVLTEYKRNSVAEVYELIEKDIEEGIDLIDDKVYTQAKYHFTKAAASAFASQFYLYKRDYNNVIKHANLVLGTGNPTSLLRDWITVYSNPETEGNVYIAAENSANLLILPTYSVYMRRFARYRYAMNGESLKGTINGAGPTWSGRPLFLNGWIWTYGQEYGLIMPKNDELFEYTDKVAGIGYPHIVRTEFTTDDVLLNRAEAKIMSGDIDGGVVDLQYWNASHRNQSNTPATLTNKAVKDFYTTGKSSFVFTFHNTELSPEFVITPDQKPFVDCVLHFRRLERLFEGHRWFDLKRYGIEITHMVGREKQEMTLKYDSPYRAIQIPLDVIGAGLEPNPRIEANINNNERLQLYY